MMGAAKPNPRSVASDSRPFGFGLLVVLAFFAFSLHAEEPPYVLGEQGTVYQLNEGTYGDLFPGDSSIDPDNPVLALDVTHADGLQERWLVPGTHSADPDSSSSLVHEKNVGVYVLWESRFNDLHPQLNLTRFDGTEWSEVIEIANGPFAVKGSPKLTVTRETGLVEGSFSLTTLHLSWWEQSGGASLKRYAPIFIRDGNYGGWSPVIDLSSFLPEGDAATLPADLGLENAVCLSPGSNDRTVIVGFVDPQTHRLNTLEVEVIPQALSIMADEARSHIIVMGVTTTTLADLAQAAAAKIIELGSQFHEATLAYMASEVRQAIEFSSSDDLTEDGIRSIADKARSHIIVMGSQFGADGLANPGEPQILEVGQSADGEGPYQYLKVTAISDRVAPEVDGTAELILSESGRGVIVKWETETHVYYRQSQEDGWTEVRTIELTDSLGRDQVQRLLEDYVRSE